MGLRIIIQGADFSAKNLGVVGLAGPYLKNAGITDTKRQVAITTFLKSFDAFGFTSKFDYIRLYTKDAAADKLNVLNPLDTDAAFRGVFNGDSAALHGMTGYKGLLGGAYITGNAHAFITEPETNTNGYLFRCILTPATYPGNDLWFAFQKNNASTTKGILERQSTASTFLTATGKTATIGLNSLALTGGNLLKMYDGGAVIAQKAQTSIPFVDGTQAVDELKSTSDNQFISQARALFTGIGRGIWLDADEANLSTILNTLKAALA
jgi:hypothetical protein